MEGLGSIAKHRLLHQQDSNVTLPSISMNTIKSMDDPIGFSGELIPSPLQFCTPDKPGDPSIVSLGNQSTSTSLSLKEQTPDHRPVQRENSCPSLVTRLSIKSDRSMDLPYNLRQEAVHKELRVQQTDTGSTLQNENQSWSRQYKQLLRHRCQCVFEGNEEHRSPSMLNSIYTELYITAGESPETSSEHEIQQIETVSKWDTSIPANDIFKAPGCSKPIRTVLTKGIAGIGKTVAVQKFTLDWVEQRANQDLDMIFPLPFREMNAFKDSEQSLIEILHCFFNLNMDAEELNSGGNTIVFIFDGLDECRFPLDFQSNRSCTSVSEPVSIDVLLTNIINKTLLPSAFIWITSRPAATGQIPLHFIDRVTEVRGFNDVHKEEYFKKKIRDPVLSSQIISHLKTSKVLHIMCHIPVFCWISASVLERLLLDSQGAEIPRTLTEMYAHFIAYQTKRGSQKYNENPKAGFKWDIQTTLKLGKLAFQELEKGNLLFYEDDLKECGIDVNAASVYSGVCTQIFREEAGLLKEKVFSFVHASIQEFLAALYTFQQFVNKKKNVLRQTTNAKILNTFKQLSLHEFLKSAVDKALESAHGRLDLFLRFLLGLSLESNQALLQELITEVLSDSESHSQTVQYLKDKIRDAPSAETAVSLLHCLSELKDESLVEDVQELVKAGGFIFGKLPPSWFSALAYILLTSAEELDVFDMNKFIHPSMSSNEGLLRLLPVIKASRSVLLNNCSLTVESCQMMGITNSPRRSGIKELHLSNNKLTDAGVKHLSLGLCHLLSGLQSLSVTYSGISAQSCALLASALSSERSELKSLDVRGNQLTASGVIPLSDLVEDPQCVLEELEFLDGIESSLPLEVPDKSKLTVEDPPGLQKSKTRNICVCS
ncbi:hypothetical protein DNTS_011899 [Danionella cerebrum]|uniref:NACHT domain-containing protein n=1 Tax=Danionella cerebrum TaxID=2873325 RepID=A0A553Q7H0_9TELE|nr:hypothetical protein DNTS_011899 [Danionella translucida]